MTFTSQTAIRYIQFFLKTFFAVAFDSLFFNAIRYGNKNDFKRISGGPDPQSFSQADVFFIRAESA